MPRPTTSRISNLAHNKRGSSSSREFLLASFSLAAVSERIFFVFMSALVFQDKFDVLTTQFP